MTNQPKPLSERWRDGAHQANIRGEAAWADMMDNAGRDLASLERQLAEAQERARLAQEAYERIFKHATNDAALVVSYERENAALREALGYLAALAKDAMRQANNDGAEYEIDAELAEATRLLHKAAGG